MSIAFITKNILNKILGEITFSPIEDYLLHSLQKEGLDKLAKPHFKIGKYEIDIAFPICKLAVECDGAEYHRQNLSQIERDEKRDIYLARRGWRIIRIEGIAIRRNINFCIEKIKRELGIFKGEVSQRYCEVL